MKRNRRAGVRYSQSGRRTTKAQRIKKPVAKRVKKPVVSIVLEKSDCEEELENTVEEEEEEEVGSPYNGPESPLNVTFQISSPDAEFTGKSPHFKSRRSLGSELVAIRTKTTKRESSVRRKKVSGRKGNSAAKKQKHEPRVEGSRKMPKRGLMDPKLVFRAAKMAAREFCGDTEYYERNRLKQEQAAELREKQREAVPIEEPIPRPVGREEEYERLWSACAQLLQGKQGQVVYLSGPPGSGKSFTLTILEHNLRVEYGKKLRFFHSNLSVQGATVPERLEHAFSKPTVFWVDEMDKGHSSVIQKLLKIAQNAPLLIIGIGNGPRFLAGNTRVTRMPFEVYTKEAIKRVIMEKYAPSLFAKGAKELVSARVANETGDIRTAISVLQRAVSGCPRGSPVTLKMVHQVLKNVPNTPSSVAASLRCLVPHARLLLCAALRLGAAELRVHTLESEYRAVCALKFQRPEGHPEFLQLLDSLCDVLVAQGKAVRLRIDAQAVRLAMPEHADILG